MVELTDAGRVVAAMALDDGGLIAPAVEASAGQGSVAEIARRHGVPYKRLWRATQRLKKAFDRVRRTCPEIDLIYVH